MKNQVFNPYLPSYEYVPDGEPHIFGDRIYVYGSHDRFNGFIFCMNDYVCWSAPADDLSDWRYEGVIYQKNQDPKNKSGIRLLFAPDVCQGADGRYYLYYAFDFMGMIGVAVCDTPAGRYQFLGHVHYQDGTIWGRRKNDPFPFDPGVLVDNDGRVWLYSGFAMPVPAAVTGGKKLKSDGGVVLELEADMVTVRKGARLLFPKEGEKAFKDHEFFEASSIRRYKDQYIFIYSSRHNHELCYAVSSRPDGDFVFGGTLVSLGDLFMDGRTDESAGTNYLGNTHGGMLKLGDDWYIFYHRQTNRHSYSRQACAERLVQNPDGSFCQSEVTSCGLNGGPLNGEGRYEARIACNLWSRDGVGRYDCRNPRKVFSEHPYFTQSGKDREQRGEQYIANMRDGAVAGFKYFKMDRADRITVELKGKGFGMFEVSEKSDFSVINARISIQLTGTKQYFSDALEIESGVKPLYFRFKGTGIVDFIAFELKEKKKE